MDAKLGLLCLLLVGIASCARDQYGNLNSPRRFFERSQIGSSPDYGVVKFGNPEDHVITVHGFSDDYASCKEIVDALNTNACTELGGQDCLNPFSCQKLN
jgi:hypothetical protein